MTFPFWRRTVAAVLMTLSAISLISAQEAVITNSLHQGIFVTPRPVQTDDTLIEAIAEVGVQQVATFSAGSDVIALLIDKCGKPSETVSVHPTYWKRFLRRNPGAADENLSSLGEQRTYYLPACAPFALMPATYDVPKGVEALAKQLFVPFDSELFKQLIGDRNFKSVVEQKFNALKRTAGLSGMEPCPSAGLARFFACVNTIEVAYLNRDTISSSEKTLSPIRFPAVPVPDLTARIPFDLEAAQATEGSVALPDRAAEKYREQQDLANVVPVPVKPDAPEAGVQPVAGVASLQLVRASSPAAATAVNAVTGANAVTTVTQNAPLTNAPLNFAPAPPPGTEAKSAVLENGTPVSVVNAPIESDVQFVSAVSDVGKYEKECGSAYAMNAGHWPFDLDAFSRIWALHNLVVDNPSQPQKILIMDTGLDFTYDNNDTPPIPERYYFPQRYFMTNVSDQADPNSDKDLDGIPGNKGWSGVNLAMLKRSGKTNVNDVNRWHGLAVATLALGGIELQQIKAFSNLPILIGIASLVGQAVPPILNREHITRGWRYAVGGHNDFKVINVSLKTLGEVAGLEEIASGKRLIIVAAAGNDGNDIGRNADGSDIAPERQVWPAAVGGRPDARSNGASVVISVGAHDGAGKLAEFSNYSSTKVAILAPGCMVPSYKLAGVPPAFADPPRTERAFVSGTSFAAPIVSFVAALISSDQTQSPSDVKQRIIVGTDFYYDLRNRVFASGILNIGKALGYRFDIIETGDRKSPLLKYGNVTVNPPGSIIDCGGETINLNNVKKIAYDKEKKQVLLLYQTDRSNPSSFDRRICDDSVLNGLTYDFQNLEDRQEQKVSLPAKEVLDYIPKW